MIQQPAPPEGTLARARRIAANPRRAFYKLRYRLLPPNSVNDFWVRAEMDRSVAEHLERLGTADLDAVEVSGRELMDRHSWKMSAELSYPEFDICSPPPIEQRYDVVICNQVLEHVTDPITAAKTLRALCKPDGTVVVGVPFLLRIHPNPLDLWRFTPQGLKVLLEAADLEVTEVHGWGNSAAVRANLYTWANVRPWRSMRNEEDLPVTVWAFAKPRLA